VSPAGPTEAGPQPRIGTDHVDPLSDLESYLAGAHPFPFPWVELPREDWWRSKDRSLPNYGV